MVKKETINNNATRSVASFFKPSMMIWPILFGLIGVGYMLWRELPDGLPQGSLVLTKYWWVFAVLAILFTLIKDLSGMYRLRVMSGVPLTFKQLFRVRMLYEFTSAVTPSAAGGSSLELVFLHREGIKYSRATSMTVLALFLDELLMILLFPLLLLLIPYSDLFTNNGYFQYGYLWAFIVGYAIKFVWVTLLSIGIFFKPSVFVHILGAITSIKFLRKYHTRALRTAVEIRQCAQEIQHKSFGFWLRMAVSTMGIWCFRFLIANMLIMIFNPLSGADNMMCFARQYILGIVSMIVPTPGGSGFAEVMFDNFLSCYITQHISTVVITSIWRVLTYYYYLIAGVIILPQWLGKSKIFNKHSEKS